LNSVPGLIVCMGVSGCGKSTLGQAIADGFDLQFVEADDYHSDSNKERMAAGVPLTDRDREPWMERLCAALYTTLQSERSCVLAHSALRKTHRDQLRGLGFRTLFLHLDGDRDIIARRIGERRDHYMPATLLDSQIDALDATQSEADILTVDIADDATHVAARLFRLINDFLMTRANA